MLIYTNKVIIISHIVFVYIDSEKDKLSPEQRKEMINTINFTLLGESTLRQALDSDIIPPFHIAKGALSLCIRLRAELDLMSATAAKQEEELKRYNFAYKRGKVTSTPNPRSYLSTSGTSSRHTTAESGTYVHLYKF